MGRIQGIYEGSLKSAGEIASHLIANCPSLNLFKSYMFGSTLQGVGQDVDVLIVGPTGEVLARLKDEIALAGEELPLHILYMDRTEAVETDFIARERCVSLSKVAISIEFRNFQRCKEFQSPIAD